MNANDSTRRRIPFLLRNSAELLALASIAMILQTGFVPFDFDFTAHKPGLRSFIDNATTAATLPDIVANIFLYLPFGVFCHWTLKRRPHLTALALPLSVLTAASLSITVEWCQAFSPSRVASVVDLVCNTLGASLGAALAWATQRTLPRVIGAILFELQSNPRATLIKLYSLLIVFFAVLPFSFSLDPTQLKRSAQTAVLVPFANSADLANATPHTPKAWTPYDLAMHRWVQLKRWSRWAAECCSFALLAWCVTSLLRREYGFSQRATVALTWWMTGLFAASLSALQFLIVSRGLDVTDVLFRMTGVALGSLTWWRYAGRDQGHDDQRRNLNRHRLTDLASAATLLYIVYTGVLPLVFDFSDGRVQKAFASPAILPLTGYFVSRADVMFIDVLEKSAAYAVLAALLATGWDRVAGRPLTRKITFILPTCLALSAVIECVQVFLPVRVPSLTDPILAAFAAVVGVAAQTYGVDLWRFSQSHEMLGPHRRATHPTGHHTLSLADRLLGSLMDPDEDAPRERTPSRHPTQKP